MLETNVVFLRARYGHVISLSLEYGQKRHVQDICINFLNKNTCPPLSAFSLTGARVQLKCWWGSFEHVDKDHLPGGMDDVMEENHLPILEPPLTTGLSCEEINFCLAAAPAFLDPFIIAA